MTNRSKAAAVQPSSGNQGNETRRLIIDVAERLFAAHGLSGVSVRTIVAEASVNLAAIHYYFGSKEALFEAVFARRAKFIVDRRLHRLDQLSAMDRPPTLEEVIEAFLAPGIRDDRSGNTGGSTFARLRARLTVDDTEFGKKLQAKYFDESSRAFLAVFAALTPHLSAVELYWRVHFMLGAMMYQMANVDRIERLSGGKISTANANVALDRLVAFFAYGLRAPADLDVQPRSRAKRRRSIGQSPKVLPRQPARVRV